MSRSSRRVLAASLAAVVATGWLVAPAAAAVTITVTTAADAALTSGCDDGRGGTSLREALCLAAQDGDGTVVVPAGTTVTLDATVGPLVVDPGGAATVLLTSDALPGFTIDGNGRRILDLDPSLAGGVDVTIERVELRGGVPDAADAAVVGGGGAILAGSADPARPDSLTLRDCVVHDNANGVPGAPTTDVGAFGGAVQMTGGSLTVERCTFRDNTAHRAHGGAIAMNGVGGAEALTITDAVFEGNAVAGQATDGPLGGGAVYVSGVATVAVAGTTFTANDARSGSVSGVRGAALWSTGPATLNGLDVVGNTLATADDLDPLTGGALWLGGGSVTASRLVGTAETVDGAARAAAVVGPAAAPGNWWGSVGGPGAGSSAVGTTTTTPYATLSSTVDPAVPLQGDRVTVDVALVLSSGGAVAPALLDVMAGRAVTWAYDPASSAISPTADATLSASGTAATELTVGAATVVTVRTTLDGATLATDVRRATLPSVTGPADVTAAEGATATFTGSATGYPTPTLQWQTAPAGSSTWTAVPGATSSSLALTANRADQGRQYRLLATNAAGTGISGAGVLTVTWGPEITTQPQDATVVEGGDATFTVAAQGSPAPTVQWQHRPAGSPTWADVVGATGTTYTRTAVPASEDGSAVRAVVTGATGPVASAEATLTVQTVPAVSGPGDVTAAEGTTATFVATVTGSPTPALQWQTAAAGSSTWTDVPGATAATLAVDAVTRGLDGQQYRVVATNAAGSVTGTPGTLTVTWGPVVTTPPGDVLVLAGEDATFSVAVAGSPAPTVQWQELATGVGAVWTDVPGATATTYVRTAVPVTDDGVRVRAVVSGAGAPVTSASALLTVHAAPTVSDPAAVTAVDGDTATFTVTTSGNPAPAVTWETAPAGSATWTTVPGATSTTLAVTATRTLDGQQYRAVVTNVAGSATSAAATLTVQWGAAVTDGPDSLTVAVGQDATFTVAVDAQPAATITWEVLDAGTWTTIAGASGATLTLAAVGLADDGTTVRARATNGVGPDAVSAAAVLTVVESPVFTTQPADATADDGTTATFTAAASGTPSPTVRWQTQPAAGATWVDVPGATGWTLTVTATPALEGAQYRAVASNPVGDAASAAATLTVLTAPTVTDPADVAVEPGAAATFTVAVAGSPAPVVTWETSADGGATWGPVAGAVGPQLVLTPSLADDGLLVRAVATSTLVGGPATAVSAAATLTVAEAPVVVGGPSGVVVAPDGTVTVRAGEPVTLAYTVAGTDPVGAWRVSVDGGLTWGAALGNATASQSTGPAGTTFTLAWTPTAQQDGTMLRFEASTATGQVRGAELTFRVAADPAAPGAPSAPAAPAAGANPASAPLPRTGTEALGLAGVALLLVLAGASLVAVRRRRPGTR